MRNTVRKLLEALLFLFVVSVIVLATLMLLSGCFKASLEKYAFDPNTGKVTGVYKVEHRGCLISQSVQNFKLKLPDNTEASFGNAGSQTTPLTVTVPTYGTVTVSPLQVVPGLQVKP